MTYVCQGTTALMWAATNGFTEVVVILMEGGADINLTNNHVRSAGRV